MKRLIVGAFVVAQVLSNCPGSQASTPEYFNRVVNAIEKAENSKKYPYGIKSINTHGDKELARRICYNSVRNNHRRWVASGKPGDFIEFMSRRYCPINAPDDNGTNRFWSGNVRSFLK